jgi:cytoskeletal protein RodZ
MAIKGEDKLPPLMAVGQLIHDAREKRGMTILGLSEKIKIEARWIVVIEAGQFERIPGRTYVFGFTRTICAALGLDADELVQVIKSEMYPDL